jgi:hypothetical protein
MPPDLSEKNFDAKVIVVGWCRTILGIVRPTEILGRVGGPRRDSSRLGTTLHSTSMAA